MNILAEQLAAGVLVAHKKFGEGVVVELDSKQAKIQFEDKLRTLNLKFLENRNLLEIL